MRKSLVAAVLMLGLVSGVQPLRAQEAPAASYKEAFDSLDGVKAYRGYQAVDQKIALVEDDTKEGKASVKSTTSSEGGYGVGGVMKIIPPTDFTGKTFSVWVKTLTPNVLAGVSVAFVDSSGKRVSFHMFRKPMKDWTQLTFTMGEKGKADSFSDGTKQGADITKVARILFYGTSRSAGQTWEILWDDFKEVSGESAPQ